MSGESRYGRIDLWAQAPPDVLVRRILKGELPSGLKRRVMLHDIRYASAEWIGMVSNAVPDDNVYRVGVFPDGIDILCFGLASIDSSIDGHYDQTDDLPEWVKERLAVLMITGSTPPTCEVAGVGRRISSHVYWVYAPETAS
jgi:hypothetical protein